MKIQKWDKLYVRDRRKGDYYGIAGSDFDTDDEFYDIVLDQDCLEGVVNLWRCGDRIPARKGLTIIMVETEA